MHKIYMSYKKMNIQTKAAIWFVFCSVLQKGISMITVPIFTRLLTTEEYGIFNIYISWFNILTIFTSLNLAQGIFNNSMHKFANDRDRYISSMQGLVITITSFTFVIYLLGKNRFNKLFGLSSAFMLMMFAEMLVAPALQFWSMRQRFEYKYKSLVLITVFKSALNPLLGIIAILLCSNHAFARVASAVAVEISFCGIILIYQFIKGKAFYVKKYWKYAVKFNLPLIPHYMSGMLLNQGDRVMIGNMLGKSAVGVYSVAYNVGMLIQIFTNAISSSFVPWFYTNLSEKKYKEIRRVFNLLLLIVATIIIMLMMFAPELVWIFASESYYEAIYVIPPVAASVFFLFTYTLFVYLEFYYEKNKFTMFASIGAAILNIILNLIFIPVYGYFAAGYTTLASYCVFCFSHFVCCKIICNQKIENDNVFDVRVILVLSVLIILSSVFFSILYKTYLIRYCILITLAILFFIKRNTIINSIKMLKK